AIHSVEAHHFSARSLFDRNRTLWCGYVIEAAGRRVYFAGDTAFGDHFARIRARCGAPDLALLPIGAYEPRWFMAPVHMNPEEAVRAHRDLRARRSQGMHFGTFPLTDEAIDAPLLALAEARALHGVAAAEFGTLDLARRASSPCKLDRELRAGRFGPVEVEELAARLIGALVGMGAEIVALRLEQVGRKAGGAVAVVIGQGGAESQIGRA